MKRKLTLFCDAKNKQGSFDDPLDKVLASCNNGNILATENQQVRINDEIEVKIGVYLHED